MSSKDLVASPSSVSRRAVLLGGAASLVASGTAAGADTVSVNPSSDLPPGLFLQLPAGINPYDVVVQTENGGDGKAITRPTKEGGQSTWNTYVPISSTQPGRILIYAPGYATFVSLLTPEHLASKTPLVVPMRRLPMRLLRGTLRDSENHPVAEKALRLNYSLIEVMPFFGYYDGQVPKVLITSGRTEKNGTFALEVPLLEDDPFLGYRFPRKRDETLEQDQLLSVPSPPGTLPLLDFSAAAAHQQRDLHPLEWESMPRSLTSEGYLEAVTLPATRVNGGPLDLEWRYPGIIHGRVAPEFLARHNIASTLAGVLAHQGDSPVYLRFHLMQQNDNGSRSASLEVRPDGGFSHAVRTGEYQLEAMFLERMGQTLRKKVVVQTGLRVKEHDSIALKIA